MPPGSHPSKKAKASTTFSDRNTKPIPTRVRARARTLDNPTGPDTPGSSSAPRPARLLAPTPPAFSRSRLGETSRAVTVDRGAEDGIGGDAVPAKAARRRSGGGVLASPGDGTGGGGALAPGARRDVRGLHGRWWWPLGCVVGRATRRARARPRP